MSTELTLATNRTKSAAWILLFLWLTYTIIYTLPFGANLEAGLETLVGVMGVVLLLLMGFSYKDIFLQVKSISRGGWIALGVATLALVGPLASSRYEGVHWIPLLVYAPLSGISQELFFRASLLPIIQRLCGGKTWSALILHAMLFGLWHVPLAYLAAPASISPWMAALLLFFVTSLAGLAWGWQVLRDQTVVWTMLHHTLLLMVMTFFGL